MNIDIEHVRAESEAYRQSFMEKWSELYGTDFMQETLRVKRWIVMRPSHAAQDHIREYQQRIREIKKILEK